MGAPPRASRREDNMSSTAVLLREGFEMYPLRSSEAGEAGCQIGHSQAAPRTPLESPWTGGTSLVAMLSGSEKM